MPTKTPENGQLEHMHNRCRHNGSVALAPSTHQMCKCPALQHTSTGGNITGPRELKSPECGNHRLAHVTDKLKCMQPLCPTHHFVDLLGFTLKLHNTHASMSSACNCPCAPDVEPGAYRVILLVSSNGVPNACMQASYPVMQLNYMYAALHHMHATIDGSGASGPCAPSRPTAAVDAAHAMPIGTQEATVHNSNSIRWQPQLQTDIAHHGGTCSKPWRCSNKCLSTHNKRSIKDCMGHTSRMGQQNQSDSTSKPTAALTAAFTKTTMFTPAHPATNPI
jgi:hypothetical protein